MKLLLDIQRQKAMMNIVKHEMKEINLMTGETSLISIPDADWNDVVRKGGTMMGRTKVLVAAMVVAALVTTGFAIAAAKGGKGRTSATQRMMPVVNVIGEMPRLLMDTVEVRAERVARPAEVVEVGSQRRRA